MPKMCIVRHSGVMYKRGGNIGFYTLPSQPLRRALWLRALDSDGLDDFGLRIVHFCSHHFLPEDYETNPEVRQSLGMDTKRIRLNPNAVPTQNLLFNAPSRERRPLDVLDSPGVIERVVKRVKTLHRMADRSAQTTRNVVAASSQTNKSNTKTL